MKYSTKLYFAMIGLVMLTLCVSQSIVYEASKELLLRSLRNKMKAIAATSSLLLDSDLLKQIHTPQDADSTAYKTVQQQLQNLRHANRLGDIFVKYMFIIRPEPNHPGMVETVADASVPPEPISPIGELHSNAQLGDFESHLEEVYAPKNFVQDNYGTWLIGFAPINDQHGQYIATLAITVSIIDVINKLDELMTYVGSAIAIALSVALVGAHFLSQRETTSLQALCRTAEEIGKGNLHAHALLETRDEFSALGEAIDAMTKGLRERERLKSNFARYVSSHVMERILKYDTIHTLESEKRKITVLFTDIRDFTRLAERLPPDEVVALLNEYFDTMLPLVFAHFGTLDKFLGDGLLIEFGAQIDDDKQEHHALETALSMQRALTALDQDWVRRGKPVIAIGAGIHTGVAIVGYMGTEQRIEYTAIGDAVIVAVALEKATKNFKAPIIISETTFNAIKDKYRFKHLGALTIPDRTSPVTIYAVEL